MPDCVVFEVMPEFDTPGHTYSWGLSKPDLLTQCYAGMTPIKGYLGPIDPVRNSSYSFLKSLFGEIMGVFKDDFLHLGGGRSAIGVLFGDQISRQTDRTGRSQQSFFDTTSPNIRLVYEYYVNRLMKDIKDSGMSRENGVRFVMWQEVMNNDLKLPNDTLIQVWMGDMADVSRAISLGYDVIYSTCWYLDHVEYGVKWPKYYQCDPVDTSYGYSIDEKKVKGGEACLWAEYIDSENLMQVTWPRTSAVAERLWSSKETRSLDAAGERLTEHRCRMLRRGLSVGQISGPDYCYRRGVSRGRHSGSGCQGDGCRPGVDVKDDVVLRIKGNNVNCTWVSHVSSNVTMLAIVAVIAFVVLVGLTRTSSRLYQFRVCKNRTILLVFLAVIFVYVMCYTTMWMQVSSGSLPVTRTSSDASEKQQRTRSKVTALQSGGMEDEAFQRVVEGRDECSKASTLYRDSRQTGQGLQQGNSRRQRS
ncbi:hypothetical protein C0Q70_19192 [Pomacea canaliculata]|uniref:beta-N-acetylhexosaminidase n=1 Tax=Pomacea canaliculata TaxID=400727 RepID=A0A2T7NIQ1_POMCA|nr:hypothetical protein C0Q70_19192 [Pomacea canaliculata]